ncbi:antibiotic biosynthesis monooxygenase family protein [Nocardia terpenica]|uniref:Antibiotic biosynthesis monooxygenase n=1 Tax=Nocardia terpenica TaxID=455432 RepID=A0A6G9Z5T8_9NOCA|nr:antibiotic biosynthesis monooxygenase family protein [Nocardia terpenica]QIS20959.1 antibiotic biosynthesis monooxygenase [Nocardia terpenica]
MSVITGNTDVFTLIITMSVKPENCDALLELIERTTKEFISHQPGFISANLHRNTDSTKLVNYGQWENSTLYAQARARAEFKSLSEGVAELAENIEPVPCRVVFTEER